MVALRNRLLASVLVALPVVAAACGAEEEAPFRVMGAIGVTVSDGTGAPGEAGFNFPTDTVLDDDRGTQDDGSLGGHCTLEGSGEAWKLEIAVRRGGAQDDGLRSYLLVVEDARTGRRPADVVADLGGNTYKSGAGCNADITVASPSSGTVALTLDCANLVSEESETFDVDTVTALEITGCHATRARTR